MVFRHGGILVAAGCLMISLLAGTSLASDAPLTADEIMQKAVARAEVIADPVGQPSYRYERRTVTDELDASGNLREHTDKLFDVVIAKRTTAKLVQVNGHAPSASELKKQEQLEDAERKRIAESRSGDKPSLKGNLFTTDLISRYQFTLVGKKEINGRAAYYLTFKPKANLPVHRITDRFLNQVAGKVWIDAEEFEIARAQIGLQTEVTLWAGIIGTLRRCDFTLDRIRLPDGAWFASSSHGVIEGRKLLENMYMRTRSECSNFRREGLAMR